MCFSVLAKMPEFLAAVTLIIVVCSGHRLIVEVEVLFTEDYSFEMCCIWGTMVALQRAAV